MEPSPGEKIRTYKLSVVIEKDSDGYFALCPELQGCYSQGDSHEEALANTKDAIRLHLEDMLENGEDIPEIESISITSLEVSLWCDLKVTIDFKEGELELDRIDYVLWLNEWDLIQPVVFISNE